MKLLRYIKVYPLSSLLIAGIWVVCMIPVPETPLNNFNFIDKWTHFLMYGTLTVVIWWEYHKHHSTTQWSRLLSGGLVCPIVMGGLIELAQAWLTTCRSGDWFDALCNSIGVILGSAIGSLIIRKKL